MTVQNKYVSDNIANDKKEVAALSEFGKPFRFIKTFEIAAADDDGSIFRLMKSMNPDVIITAITLWNDAIAGATSYDIGLYEPLEEGQGGAVIDKDVYLAAEDINAGNPRSSPVDGLTALNIDQAEKRIYENAGDLQVNKRVGYDIAVTANVVGAADGTITVLIEGVQG